MANQVPVTETNILKGIDFLKKRIKRLKDNPYQERLNETYKQHLDDYERRCLQIESEEMHHYIKDDLLYLAAIEFNQLVVDIPKHICLKCNVEHCECYSDYIGELDTLYDDCSYYEEWLSELPASGG